MGSPGFSPRRRRGAEKRIENEKLKDKAEFLRNELLALEGYNESKNKKIAKLENKIKNLENKFTSNKTYKLFGISFLSIVNNK